MQDDTIMDFWQALEAGVPELLAPVLGDLRDEVLASLAASDQQGNSAEGQIAFLLEWANAQLREIERLHDAAAIFGDRFGNASEQAEQQAAILDLASQLGANQRQLDRDKRAFTAFFDEDAVMERYRKRVSERERAATYALDRSGALLALYLKNGTLPPDSDMLMELLRPTLSACWHYRGDVRLRQAAHQCLRQAAQAAPDRLTGLWVDQLLSEVRRVALDEEDTAWLQCESLSSLLALSPESLAAVLKRRFSDSAGSASPQALDNRIFVRRHLARLLAAAIGKYPELDIYLRRLANDRDGAVRQAVAQCVPILPEKQFGGYFAKMRVDRDPQVRAMLLSLPQAMADASGGAPYLSYLLRVFRRETDSFVLRMAIWASEAFAEWQFHHDAAELDSVITQLRQALTGLRERSEDLRIRRWAAASREKLWLIGNPQAREIAEEVQLATNGLNEGQSCKIRLKHSALDCDPELVGRVLAIVGAEDFGFDYTPGRRTATLRRGDEFCYRLWRFLHELRISATDKRQAWYHTIGRRFTGPIIAPPAHMAELAPTKVPGEPLHQSKEGGWRNYLPLLDHVLCAIDRGGQMQIFTSEGITTIQAPDGIFARISAYCTISWQFARLAALRNGENRDYVKELRKHGVQIHYRPYSDEPASPDAQAADGDPDPQVERFFNFGAIAAAAPTLLENALDYFGSVFQNSLFDLAVFIALACGYFVGKHVWAGRKMRAMRDNIALSLGGWGTRGKSGTERLKAGLINALGHPLVSKTTGCEAMFLNGTAFGELQELFLFRPYDKATIWEQFNLLQLTNKLKGRVFLWECMGLAPQYVRVLQKDWMRDTIGTITNTYPDHEDVQGPAGRNIPEVMTQFIPENSILLTTEEEMLPILAQGARKYGTRIRPVGWRQAGLVHENLLARFPYAEHPYNIALVTAMADELGMEPDFAVKEMSDRVVADLGVLKIYPHSRIYGRTLEFVMGMSANERFGAMGNWDRMGFAHHDLGRDPEIFVSTVVNNRADRVPRSRVFARMLVRDVAADRHILIGSNIEGLVGFLDEEWQSYAATLTLFEGKDEPGVVLEQLARQQRVALNEAQLFGRLDAMLAAQESQISAISAREAARNGNLAQVLADANVEYGDAIARHYDEQAAFLKQYQQLAADVAGAADSHGADIQMRAFLRGVFMAKIVPVRDYYTSGEQVVRLVARNTPPGLTNRIMGMQNIKGTGLDWVYRWQAWETVHKAATQLQDRDPSVARRGADLLASFQEFGILSEHYVRQVITELKSDANQVEASIAGQLDGILARLDRQMAILDAEDAGDKGGSDASGGGGRLVNLLEAWLDSHDALRRRNSVERIYDALVEEQISSQRAALELKKLVSRQKGGWLGARLSSMGSAIRALLHRRLMRGDG